MKGEIKIAPWTPLPLVKKKKIWFKTEHGKMYHRISKDMSIFSSVNLTGCGMIEYRLVYSTGKCVPPLNQRCTRCMKVKKE